MDYLTLVLEDPLFADYAIAGLVIFGIFGLWRFYALYLLIIVFTFNDATKMKYAIITLVMVLSFHYIISTLTPTQKSPFRGITQ